MAATAGATNKVTRRSRATNSRRDTLSLEPTVGTLAADVVVTVFMMVMIREREGIGQETILRLAGHV